MACTNYSNDTDIDTCFSNINDQYELVKIINIFHGFVSQAGISVAILLYAHFIIFMNFTFEL